MHLIHDLRLVLIAIKSCLETRRRRARGGPLPPEIEHIERLLQTGLAITDELLVSRSLHPAAPFVEVNSLLQELNDVVGAIVGPDVALKTQLLAAQSRVYAQPLDLERVVLNAVFNAAAAMPNGGALLIETELAPVNNPSKGAPSPFGNLRITIRDTGRGIPESNLAEVIDPMAKPRQDGTGLGLASIALILTRLGGSFGVESRPGEGTIVTIELPLWPGHGTQPH